MTGLYKNGKVLYRTPRVVALTGGNWKSGWSGTKSMGGDIKEYEVSNHLTWWPTPNQEVDFEVVDDKAVISKLGKTLDEDKANRLYSSSSFY